MRLILPSLPPCFTARAWPYALLSCLCRPDVCSEGVARYDNGGVYIGAFEAEKRCGWGTHYFPDRSKYEGEWRGDVMEGA